MKLFLTLIILLSLYDLQSQKSSEQINLDSLILADTSVYVPVKTTYSRQYRVGISPAYKNDYTNGNIEETVMYGTGGFFDVAVFKSRSDQSFELGWRANFNYLNGTCDFNAPGMTGSMFESFKFSYLSSSLGLAAQLCPGGERKRLALGASVYSGINFGQVSITEKTKAPNGGNPLKNYHSNLLFGGISLSLNYNKPFGNGACLSVGGEVKLQSPETNYYYRRTIIPSLFVGFIVPYKGPADRKQKLAERRSASDSVFYFHQAVKYKFALEGGIGIQVMGSAASQIGNKYTSILYTKAGSAWINAVVVNGRINYSLRIKTSYREGALDIHSGNAAFKESIVGHFCVMRTELGVIVSRAMGRKRNLFIGAGVYSGYAPYIRYSASSVYGYAVNSKAYRSLDFNRAHVGMCADIHQQFRLRDHSYLVAGINARIESSEIQGTVADVIETYLAYRFYKSPKK